MKKILIVSYYHLKESLLQASDSLIQLGYDICNYPLFQYAYDKNDKINNYLDNFLEYIVESDCHIILWWFFGIPSNDIQFIRNKTSDKFHVLYNWDDPYCWNDSMMNFGNKCKNFDLVISSCKESDHLYYQYGVKKVIYGLPGFSPEVHYQTSSEYDCDISFCCTNLYENQKNYPEQYINRKYLIDKIYECPDITFHIYGSDYLGELYPKSYKGFVQYGNNANVFRRSKINLSTHIITTKSGYVNERSIQILACGGLLLVDKVKDFPFIDGEDCIIIDKEDPIKQIKDILENYNDKYDKIKKNDHKIGNYTWLKWAEKLHEQFAKHFFDYKFYRSAYKIDSDDIQKIWDHWRDNRTNLYDNITIPKKFNLSRYKNDNGLESDVDELIYWHWKTIGKSNIKYIIKVRNNDIVKDNKIALIKEEEYRLFYLFSRLANREKGETDKCLREIEEIVKSSPYLSLKNCLDEYFQ